MTTAVQIARGILEPLCDETRRLLRPVMLDARDHLDVALDKSGRHFIVEAYKTGYVEGEKLFASWNARNWHDRVPECTKVDGHYAKWMMAATDITALIIDAIWPVEKTTFTTEARLVYDTLLMQFMHQSYASRIRADYKINGAVPDMPGEFIEHPEFPLANFQKIGVLTTYEQYGSALFAQQGTGKTPMAIARMCTEAVKKRNEYGPDAMYHAIVVVPKNVRMNWQREVHKFATVPGKVTVLRGGQLDRMKLLIDAMSPDPECYFSIVICSYDTVRLSWEPLSMIEWDICVADESHNIKNPQAKRQKFMRQLREQCKRRMCMTGTPITNTLLDLYTQLEFMGEGFSGFQSWKAFRTFYAKFDKNEYTGREEFHGYQNLPFLQERLARLAFMITKKEALPFLPEKTYDTLECAMTARQLDVYKSMQESLAAEIDNKIDEAIASGESRAVTVNCVLTMLLRLAQITSGFTSLDARIDEETGEVLDKKKIVYFSPIPKLEALIESIKKDENKVIVWATFIPDILKISERLTAEGIKHVKYYGGTSDADRDIAERTFNCDPDVKVFLGNPAAGGVGLNLWGHDPNDVGDKKDTDRDVDHVYYYSQNWSMVHRSQSEDRCHRRGTRVSVRYTTLVVPNAIDEEIMNRVTGKIQSANDLQDVRQIMHRVLSVVPDVEVESDDDNGND